MTDDDGTADLIGRERSRLRNFIRSRVPDPRDAEDILQDVFASLVEANQLLMPIEHVTGWLFRVARNRITDLFRRRKPEPLEFEDLLPSPDAGFGWRPLTFWQALRLLVLCRILFGGLGRHGGGPRMSHRLPPEERERFRQRIRERFGFGPRAEGGEPRHA